jgi:hypothetical protein
VVALADVLPHRHRVVVLKRRGGELVSGRRGNVQPELLRRCYVGVFVDVDAEA